MPIRIQNMCGNGGQTGGQTGGGGAVNKVNGVAPGADGNVRLTADNLGAALAATNIQSVTKKYRRFIAQDGNEGVTPKNYLWSLGKGSFFLRAADGVHFVACVDIADGLKARIYAMIPPTSANDGDVIDGGVYINNTKLAAFGSTEDLQELIFKIGDSPIITMTGLEARLAASSVSPIDLTAEYAEWLSENSTGTPDMFFMTVTDAGVYTMSDSTGLWHCCRVIRASDGDDAELYRLIYSMGTAEAAASIRLLNAGLPTPLVCDNKITFTRGISVPTPVGTWDATPMGYVDALRASHRAMIVARPTTAQARQIADEAVAARLPLGEMSTVSTRLEKCSVDRVRYIRVDLMNNDFLRSLHEAGDHISLHFLMCSRKQGRGHHWWHPSNYDHEPTGNEPFRLGYASMAGKRVNDYDQTVFPPVPDWMPGDGWMQTELTIGADDLYRGYVLIDPATYFLPMVKPSVYGQDGNWGKNISVVSTRRKDAGKPMPFVCTWQVAVNGVEIGRPLDVLRVGCSRNSDSNKTTTLQIVDGNARVVKLYTSVSR